MTPLECAATQVGVKEAPGNGGVPLERYGLSGEEPLPWCARFVRWCFVEAKQPLPGQKYLIASVIGMQEALRTRGAILPLEERPRPGDIIFLHDRGKSDAGTGHHVGIVERVSDSLVTSIDGNWGDQVARVERRRGDPHIWCFGRWPAEARA